MSAKNRLKRPRGWKAYGGPYVFPVTRQQKRKIIKQAAWNSVSGPNVLRDDKGLIPRRVRRSIARALAHRDWKNRPKKS